MEFPLLVTEKNKVIGTAGDIALVDIGSYIIAGKGNGVVKSIISIQLKFNYDEQPWWLAPVTPKYGGSTLSPFVVLSSSRS